MFIPAYQVQVGDLVDLERDEFADPTGSNPSFEFLYTEVVEIVDEGMAIAIGFDGFAVVGFPRDHLLNVVEREKCWADD